MSEPKFIDVVCIKSFLYKDKQFLKNTNYRIIEYTSFTLFGDQRFYIIEAPKSQNIITVPAYTIKYKHRKNFMSQKEYRKLKLEKIEHENKLNILYKRFFGYQ